MKPIGVLVLPHRRIEFLNLMVHFLKKCRPETKSALHFYIFYTEAPFAAFYFEALRSELNDAGYDCEIKAFPSGELCYRQKVTDAVTRDHPYFIKIDEDCIFNEHIWDALCASRDRLNWDEDLLLSLWLSAGIPTNEDFVNLVFDDLEKEQLEQETLKTRFGSLWNSDYSSLNAATLESQSWQPEVFYDLVSKLDTAYKGIHPIRINFKLAKLQNSLILNHIPEILRKRNYELSRSQKPYFCNNCFLIPRDRWKEILSRTDLFVDNSDEVPISRYRAEKEMNFVFLREAVGIHTLFNTHHSIVSPEIANQHEWAFFEELKSRIIASGSR